MCFINKYAKRLFTKKKYNVMSCLRGFLRLTIVDRLGSNSLTSDGYDDQTNTHTHTHTPLVVFDLSGKEVFCGML